MTVIRQRTKNLIWAGLIGALSMFVFASGIAWWGYQALTDAEQESIAAYQLQLEEAERRWNEYQNSMQEVYVLNRDIEAGTTITEDLMTKTEVSQQWLPHNILSKQAAVGKIAKIDIQKNTALIPSMLFEEGGMPDDLRNNEFRMIALPSKLKAGDYTDIRIKFPTGHDYIVLSKKKVKDLTPEMIWIEMNEEEILTMSSALVDAYLEKATIYALSYVEPYMQDQAIVTYPVKESVLELIQTDPNIVQMAITVLERRHRESLEKALNQMGDSAKAAYTNESNAVNRLGEDQSDIFTNQYD